MYNQEYDATNEDSPIFDKDVDNTYWTCIEKPIFYVSRKGGVDLETFKDLGVEEEHAEFSYDHLEPYHPRSHTSISNEEFERQCIKESDLIQLIEGYREPRSSHSEVPYDLEQPGAYKESYHSTSPFDICDGVVDPLHHVDVYISPNQAWIEEAYESLC